MSSLQPNHPGDWIMLVLSAAVAGGLVVSIVVSDCAKPVGSTEAAPSDGERADRRSGPESAPGREENASSGRMERAGGSGGDVAGLDVANSRASRGAARDGSSGRAGRDGNPSQSAQTIPTSGPDGGRRSRRVGSDRRGRLDSAAGGDATVGRDLPSRGSVNERLLGPRDWRAELTDEQRRAVERNLLEPGALPGPLDRRDRRRAEAAIRRVARQCYRGHVSRGQPVQLVVRARLMIDGARGRVDDPSVSSMVGLEAPDFRRCLRSKVAEVEFPARRDGDGELREVLFLGGAPGEAGR